MPAARPPRGRRRVVRRRWREAFVLESPRAATTRFRMQKKRLSTLIVPCLLALAAFDAGALGFAPVEPSTTLGQPLDHVIGLQLDPGETLNPECVAADIVVGETRLASTQVRARLERRGDAQVLRVRTTVPMDEPLVAMTLSLGCPTKLQRRFVVFADPVAAAAPSAPLALAQTDGAQALPPADLATAPAAGTATTPQRPRASPTTQLPQPVQTARERARDTAEAAPAAAPRPKRRRVAPRAPAAESPAAPAAPRERPRLRLDAEPWVAAGAGAGDSARLAAAEATVRAQAQAQAIEDARAQAAAEAASAAAARVAALEQAIERMRADSAADRQALLELRQRAAEADARGQWTPWLLALAVLLTLLCAWLLSRLRRLQQQSQQAWARVAQGATGPGPEHGHALAQPHAHSAASALRAGTTDTLAGAPPTSSDSYSSTSPGLLSPGAESAAGDGPRGGMSAVERTEVLPVGWRGDEDESRDVSIEELIDLEQQAEFFVVLGQEDAAIDLLVDHLRKTGGGSPMPYLKLLEIYRRRGDHEAYERTRARFNHRFNAYAPQWDADASEGRALEDYPAIVARLQQVWPVPLDAMAELEALLFRKARGELFDLPAYRDVIFLYSLARDLLDRESLESGKVDVLLPISESGEHTQPMSLEDLPPAEDSDLMSLDQPTVPIDLDVTQPMSPHSLFGETDPATLGKGRRRRNGG